MAGDSYASLLESGDISLVENKKIRNRQFITAGLIVLVLIVAYILLAWVSSVKDHEDDIMHEEDLIFELAHEINLVANQNKHVVKYRTPVQNQQARGTCWDFATVSVAEANYMKQGYENGWLKENEYVKFSEQAYGIAHIDNALAHPEFYPDTKTASYHASDGYIYWLYLFQNYLENSMVPHSVPGCEYAESESDDATVGTKDSTDYKCDYLHKNQSQNIERNPIRIKNVDMQTFIDFEDAKQFLRHSDLPLGFSVMLTASTYYLPCSSNFFTNTEQCQNKSLKCPSYLEYDSEFCASITAPAVEDSVFTVSGTEQPRGGHAMNVVGFTDSLNVDLGSDYAETNGGFIIKNSWDAETGHSVHHYTQEWSSRAEHHVCPTAAEPKHWVPCVHDTDMWKMQDTTILSCRTTDHHYPAYLKNLTNILDGIDCTTETRFCYEGSTPMGGNLSEHNFRKWTVNPNDPLAVPEVYETVTVDYLPLGSLSHVFEISNEQKSSLPSNDKHNCGYYFYPYTTVRHSTSLWGEFWALGMEIEFDKCSFAANKHLSACKSYDYTWVEKSTHTIDVLHADEWVSPMPIVEDLLREAGDL